MRAQDNFSPFPEGSGRIDIIQEIQWSQVDVPDQIQRLALESGLGGVATFASNPTGSPAARYVWRAPREISATIGGEEIIIPFDTMFKPNPKGGVSVEAISKDTDLPVTVRMKIGQAGVCLGRLPTKEDASASDSESNVVSLYPAAVA